MKSYGIAHAELKHGEQSELRRRLGGQNTRYIKAFTDASSFHAKLLTFGFLETDVVTQISSGCVHTHSAYQSVIVDSHIEAIMVVGIVEVYTYRRGFELLIFLGGQVRRYGV